MNAPMNFRSAFNGFNREDVVRYIEYISARHTAELNQLNSQIEYLKTKSAPAVADATDEALKARIDALLERCAQLEDAVTMAQLEAEDKIHAAEDRCKALEAQLAQAQKQASDTTTHISQELEAYRRAERTERMAQERAALMEKVASENAERTLKLASDHADAICTQVNVVLAEASLNVDSAAADVAALAESVMAQLAQLQTAIVQSKATLRMASDKMYAVHSPKTPE